MTFRLHRQVEVLFDIRYRIGLICLLAGILSLSFGQARGGSLCDVDHPLNPPEKQFAGQCPNCGMVRAMWARTWFTFESSSGKTQACSLHCLADMARKSGQTPGQVRVARYLEPDRMVFASKAFFVVGSTARGTMTMQSKPAFATRNKAEEFVRRCGGKIIDFDGALAVAAKTLTGENQTINKNRMKKGKIVDPVDNKDQCPVCNMYPARYPHHMGQIQTKDNLVYHFCATQCLFKFLANSKEISGKPVKPFLIWVNDYPGRMWIAAKTATYVLGSNQWGPMGHEAFAFDTRAGAEEFVEKNGGKIRIFDNVTIEELIQKKLQLLTSYFKGETVYAGTGFLPAI